MKQFYVTFLLLLVVSSLALTELIASAGAMRAGSIGLPSIAVTTASFAALALAGLLLARILYVLSGHEQPPTNGGSR